MEVFHMKKNMAYGLYKECYFIIPKMKILCFNLKNINPYLTFLSFEIVQTTKFINFPISFQSILKKHLQIRMCSKEMNT